MADFDLDDLTIPESSSISTASASSDTSSERADRLFALELKSNQSRKLLREEVKAEEQRKRDGPQAERKKRKAEWDEKQRKYEMEAEEKGIDIKRRKLRENVTAEDAELEQHLKKKKKREVHAWSAYNQEAAYYSYKKRVKSLENKDQEYEEQKIKSAPEVFYADSEALSIAQPPPDPSKVDRMTDELHKSISKRRDYSRHRAFVEDADVDYINSGNSKFNQKIKRAFDKYTVEIKQNLERGTAV